MTKSLSLLFFVTLIRKFLISTVWAAKVRSMASSAWSCFMKKSQKQQLKAKSKINSRKRKLNPGSINGTNDSAQPPATKKRKISNIQSIKCPVCHKKLLSNLINFHIEEHFTDCNQNKDKENNNNNNHNHNNRNTSETSVNSLTTNISSTNIECNENTNNSSPITSPITLPSKPSSPKSTSSNEQKTPKICPLFTSGALPASMFTKGKKRSSSNIPAQEAIFYVGIITDNTDQRITSWNAEWIDSSKEEIKSFLSKSEEMDYFITNVMIKEPNTIGPTKVYLICNYPSNDGPIQVIGNEFRFNYPSPNNWRFSPSLIKSLLQKAVRVSYDQTAIKAAYLLLLKDSLQSLLRRLSIIIIEDVILIKDYILLIWLLLSESKSNQNEKYHPKISWYNWLFSLVCYYCYYYLFNCEYILYSIHKGQKMRAIPH